MRYTADNIDYLQKVLMLSSQPTEKTRKIIVDNQEYHWTVTQMDTVHACLKVWLSTSTGNPWLTVKYRFDNPWIGFGEKISLHPEQIAKYLRLCPIQPRLVVQIIKKVNKTHAAKPIINFPHRLNYLFNMDGQLEQLSGLNDGDRGTVEVDLMAK